MSPPILKRRVIAAAAVLSTSSVFACPYHLNYTGPIGVTIPEPASVAFARTLPGYVVAAEPTPAVDSYVNSWLLNTTGLTGRSGDTTINNAVKTISANVQQVRYTSTNVYVNVSSIPDYNIGSFNGNPNIPANASATFSIPRVPAPASGTHTSTGLGAIGVLVNGVEFFNMSDARSYNNANVWHNNAGLVESPSFDAAKGHPQQQGVYHNHMTPTSLAAELGASSTNTQVLGYAIDGYPLMSDYASLTPGGSMVKMTSSYQLKIYANNIRGNGGPVVSTSSGANQYPIGYFQEDYQYVAGAGLLDQYNGATVYTPQFPGGTYAYFATTDSSGNAAYPYLVGPTYYGTPLADNLTGGTIAIPSTAVTWTGVVPEPAMAGVIAIGLAAIRRRGI